MPERAYRKALVKEHCLTVKIMRKMGAPKQGIERERELIKIMWWHYREAAGVKRPPLVTGEMIEESVTLLWASGKFGPVSPSPDRALIEHLLNQALTKI